VVTTGTDSLFQSRRFRLILCGAIGLALADFVLLDRWQVEGRVLDERGAPAAGAHVLVRFVGQKPLINLPVPPHPNHRHGVCIGSREVVTDKKGRFRVDVVTLNRAVANKSANIEVLAHDQIRSVTGAEMHSSLFAWAPNAKITLSPPIEARIAGRVFLVPHLTHRLGEHEWTYSREVADLAAVISRYPCGRDDLPEVSRYAMERALSIAQTFSERNLVAVACRGARKWLKTRQAHAGERWWNWGRVEDSWPFDCENLDFKQKPSDAALEVERILRESRQQRQRSQAAV
jgi:hypothetical protein